MADRSHYEVCTGSTECGFAGRRWTVIQFVCLCLVGLAAAVADCRVGVAAGSPQPFAIGMAAVNGHPNNLVQTVTIVPAGVRWTIQNISVVCFVPNGTSISAISVTTSLAGVVTGITPTVPDGRFFSNSPYPRAVVQLSQPTLTYADPGTQVVFTANLETIASTSQFSCAVDLMGLATPTAS
jgi:hypothetical protein